MYRTHSHRMPLATTTRAAVQFAMLTVTLASSPSWTLGAEDSHGFSLNPDDDHGRLLSEEESCYGCYGCNCGCSQCAGCYDGACGCACPSPQQSPPPSPPPLPALGGTLCTLTNEQACCASGGSWCSWSSSDCGPDISGSGSDNAGLCSGTFSGNQL